MSDHEVITQFSLGSTVLGTWQVRKMPGELNLSYWKRSPPKWKNLWRRHDLPPEYVLEYVAKHRLQRERCEKALGYASVPVDRRLRCGDGSDD